MLRRNCIGSEGSTHGQTDIYYILDSGGYNNVPYQILLIPEKIWRGVDLGFFNMKRDQREKTYFYKICRFFFIFLKLIFDRICIPPPKKDWGI